ncbi:ferritin-like domain-containing protein [Niabella insulamsoli]|uniref:YciE/YciF ferroxidase family protein n=1 Tax=Niabella insulamsoli TaxID=3144874 RepID=UPI0031FBD88E
MAKAKAPAKKAAAKKTSTKSTSRKVAPKKDAATELMELFEHGLKDIYWAEKALVKALPKMEKNASSPDLKKAIAKHLEETKGHVSNLESVFSIIGKKAQAKKCDAMEGLLEEGKSILEETSIGAVRDAGIIAASQKVEHYEIATYGTLATYAKALDLKKAMTLLLETLDQEKNCDETLTDLAKGGINLDAID